MNSNPHVRLLFWAFAWLALALPASRADYYAAQNGQTPAGPYTSWETAASNIQDAVNAAANNSTVWVGAGRYTVPPNATNYWGSNVVYINRPLSLRSSNSSPDTVIIDGEGKHRGLIWYFSSSSTSIFLLDGLTITNCSATNMGGGILFAPSPASYNVTATVQNCVLSDNTAQSDSASHNSAGGGFYFYSGSGFGLTLSNCVIRNNISTNTASGYSTYAGGAHVVSSGKKHITGCLVENNRSSRYGGGIYANSSDLLIENSIFHHNQNYNDSYNYGGGAMHFLHGVVTIRNCLIYNNYANSGGGSIFKFATTGLPPEQYGLMDIHNCTFISNTINVRRADRLNISNSILYTNYIVCNAGPMVFFATNSWIYYNSVTGGSFFNGTGNITNGIDPCFVNRAGHDYRLDVDSPCVNTGTNQEWMNESIDLDGRERIRYGTVDMGAHEHVYEGTLYRLR